MKENTQPSVRTLASWLIGITRPVLRPLTASTLARIANQSLGIALYVIPVVALIHLAQGRSLSFWWVLTAMVLISLAKAFLRYLEHYLGHLVAFKALELIRIRVFRDIYPQAPAIVHRTGKKAVGSGDMLARLTRDIGQIEVFFAHTTAPVISALVVPTAVVAWALFVSPWQGLIAASIFVIVAVVSLDKSAYRRASSVADHRGALSQHVSDTAGGVAEITGYGIESVRMSEMKGIERGLSSVATSQAMAQGSRLGIVAALRMASIAALATPLVFDRSLDLAVGIAIIFAVIRCWDMINEVSDLGSQLSNSFAAARRVWELSNAGYELVDGEFPLPASGEGLSVEFDHVGFSYESATRPALNDVTFTAQSSKWTAIVGTTGSGKSTVAKLLLRYFDPSEGQVRIGGRSICDYRVDDLRAAVGIASQEAGFLDATVETNLRLAAPSVSQEELEELLRVACLDGELDLDSEIGPGGSSISGGQRQRLNLAQALLRGGRVLLLDEFTAHLNPRLAAQVRSRVAEFRPTATVIEITHLLDGIDSVDHVVVIDGGKVVEAGSPTELLAAQGSLARLKSRNIQFEFG